ncbi:VanZ family protein [Enterococcus sp. HY326]|uniref:VanZ family protein n=1 Tax=Enterococcus sp. HY326 TaxID=2971265 RepID=UPI00223F4DF1|nr:VanZ family protein [Enterococcus sp. HY326]
MGIVVSLALTCIYLFLNKKTITKLYVLWSILFVFYLSVLLSEIVGFPNMPELNRMISNGDPLFNPIINWVPFSEGFDISSLLNIIAFIPLGVALIVMWRRFQKVIAVIFLGISFSMLIEIGQLFTLFRQTDINDIIMNTLGVLAGWVLGNYIFKWKIQRKNGVNIDWFVFILISFSSVFIFG